MNSSAKRNMKYLLGSLTENPEKMVLDIHPKDEMYLFLLTCTFKGDEQKAMGEYFLTGRQATTVIENLVAQYQGSMANVSSLLDFACGYGRSTRFLTQKIESQKIWCSDISDEAVDFQKSTFGISGFYSCSDPKDIVFPRKFDVIYVGSLFSHLPPQTFQIWLETLYHQLEDDGILLFSTHGPSALPEGDVLSDEGYYFKPDSEIDIIAKDEYGSMFVTRDWVETAAKNCGINHIGYLPKELWSFQDLYIVAKKPLSSPIALTSGQGVIDTVHVKDNCISVQGWAVSEESTPVGAIEVFANGLSLGNAHLGLARPDVSEHFKVDEYLSSGWEISKIPLPQGLVIDGGEVMVTARIENGRGVFLQCLSSSVEL